MKPQHPTITLTTGQEMHGFVMTDLTPLPEMGLVAYQFEHAKSGARLLHLHGEDAEKLFAIAFRTPPPDDTGLPHILEHSVLCGSQKYPVKDPFVHLLQISLATFLNAMTYPDKTVYPCASMNEKDFLNLVSVYCDAVFRPLIPEMVFKQEGHHFDFVEPGKVESPLTIKGIVYNEMKGNYSDLDGIIYRKTSAGIFPGNAYGKDSGGDPDAIPTLTFAQFKDFHRRYYHPANSLIFLYGNIAAPKVLKFLDEEYLGQVKRITIDTSIALQKDWQSPCRETIAYPIGVDEDAKGKAAVVLTFRTNPLTDAVRTLAMQVLEYYLLGNAASPLRKALIDSKLGEELTHSGYVDHQRDTYFTVGLKGTEADRAGKIEQLVKDVCAAESKKGLDREKVETSLHRLEMAAREIQSMWPLRLMDRAYTTWLYDADPLHNLRMNEHLEELRSCYESEPRFLEQCLDAMLINNPHYTVHTFVPDREYMARKEATFRAAMEARKGGMSAANLERIREEAAKLDALQSAPNTPEQLATLPHLALADVPPEPMELSTRVETVASRPCLLTDIFANGVNYLNLAFDLNGLDADLVDFVPLFAEALTKMGAAGLDYAAMAEREASCTGGVGAGASANGRMDNAAHVQPFLVLRASALDRKLEDMFAVVADRILRPDFTDRARLKDVILQGKVHRHAHIVPAGSHFAALYAARGFSENAALSERWGGITQVRHYDHMAVEFDAQADAVVEKLQRIQSCLSARGRVYASFVGAEAQRRVACAWLRNLLGSLRDEDAPEASGGFQPGPALREGVATPADVAFVATVMPAPPADHPDAAALLFLSQSLSYGHLWNEIRAKRGAYGAHAGYQGSNTLFSFTSYRDPCIRETLDTYAGVCRYVESGMDLSPAAVEQAIIGTVKTLDRPIRPGQAVGVALGRYLGGETPAFRKAFRQRLLGLQGEDIRRVAREALASGFTRSSVCVLSSREKLTAANATLPEALAITDL